MIFFFWGRVGSGGGGGRVGGCQGGCERRSEAFVKIQKFKNSKAAKFENLQQSYGL